MTTADDYINRVLQHLPQATPQRSQIAMELRGHITERLGFGHSLDEVLHQLGDPVQLAESYLSAVPLVAAPFGRRAIAKLTDFVLVLAALAPIVWLGVRLIEFDTAPGPGGLPMPADFMFPLALGALIIGGSFTFAFYTMLAEYAAGKTLGKHLFAIRVVRESGARISLGQAIVRQLPMFSQVYWIDVMFALFTEKKQRAFELLSKTRTVLASGEARP